MIIRPWIDTNISDTETYDSPVGKLSLIADTGEDVFDACLWLDEYFAGKRPKWFPKLKLQGTPFQLQVWKLLKEIPYGTTLTYKELALQLSPTMSAQAVGQAIGKNPCCIIIPCHRIIGKNGSLTGYAYGLKLKQELLNFEYFT